MAQKCGSCGSTDTSTGGGSHSCLICGAVTVPQEQTPRGRVPNPDAPTGYAGDNGTVYHGDKPLEPVAAKPVKSKTKR